MATEEPTKPTTPPASDPQTENAPTTPPADAQLTPDPLSDGTVPTILEKSDGSSSIPAPTLSKQPITSVYRRADIATSLITMAATLAVIGLVAGGYIFLTKKKVAPPPKVTTLDQTEITKLGGFLTGNAVGGSAQVLTVSSSSLFKGRLAIDNDLKVTGNGEYTGGLSSTTLTVTKNSTLANTTINGSLTVSGPTTLQSPAILAGGATIGSNLTVAGSGSFGGAVSAGTINAKTLSVSGDLNLAGHLVISGALPTVSPEAGSGTGATASVEGTDSAGTITLVTTTIPSFANGQANLVSLKFKNPFLKTPHVLITPVGVNAGELHYYVIQSPQGFTISVTDKAKSSLNYAYNYWVIQ